VPLDLGTIGRDARLLEEIGYHGMVVEETKDDPFVIMALAAQATGRLKLATSVAIAFPRSPTVMAMSAWTIQKLSKGRFTLGPKPAGARPYRAPVRRVVAPPAPGCVNTSRRCGRSGTPADRRAARRPGCITTSTTVPLFNPGATTPRYPIHLAAVNPSCAAWPARWPTVCASIRSERPPTSSR
jgi:hypothetical protein